MHRNGDIDGFLASHFSDRERSVLLVAGAGFDPRSCAVANRLTECGISVGALLIRENRPNPPPDEVDRAEANTEALRIRVPESQLASIDMFGHDNAVVGGRNVVEVLRHQKLSGVTDVIVDISALSVGTTFPIVRYFAEYTGRRGGHVNLHVFVVHDPRIDAMIRPIAGDAPGYIHGFKGRSTLSDTNDAARLWLPQLAAGQGVALGRLYDFVEPHDTCPILPFPASDPRLGDALAEEYLTELEDTWEVDTRNIVYSDESDPLDLYRTILRLDDLRKPVFAETGGSLLILSPLGSKVMALGGLMAALERDLPVAYVESIDYDLEPSLPEAVDGSNLVHLWLEGDAYPQRAVASERGSRTG